jgi:hypothetical protein
MIYVIILGVVVVVSTLWAYGIDNMHKTYPEYKGEDFL